MEVNTLAQTAVATLVAVAWKVAGAVVLWLLGRWLIVAILGFFGVDEHVDTRRMTVPKAKWTSGFGNRLEVFTIDRDIDVPRQSGGHRLDFVNVHIGRESTDYAILYSGLRERFG